MIFVCSVTNSRQYFLTTNMFSHQNRTVYYTKSIVRPATDHLKHKYDRIPFVAIFTCVCHVHQRLSWKQQGQMIPMFQVWVPSTCRFRVDEFQNEPSPHWSWVKLQCMDRNKPDKFWNQAGKACACMPHSQGLLERLQSNSKKTKERKSKHRKCFEYCCCRRKWTY